MYIVIPWLPTKNCVAKSLLNRQVLGLRGWLHSVKLLWQAWSVTLQHWWFRPSRMTPYCQCVDFFYAWKTSLDTKQTFLRGNFVLIKTFSKIRKCEKTLRPKFIRWQCISTGEITHTTVRVAQSYGGKAKMAGEGMLSWNNDKLSSWSCVKTEHNINGIPCKDYTTWTLNLTQTLTLTLTLILTLFRYHIPLLAIFKFL